MKLVREYINEKFREDSDPIKDMGIGGYTSTKNVEFTIGRSFNQFSFSKYDNKKFKDFKGYPVYKEADSEYVLVTPFNWISDIPIYDEQLQLIIDAIEKDFLELDVIPFSLRKLSISYNNYGRLFLLWTTEEYDEKVFSKILKFFNEEEWAREVDDLSYKFHDINDPEINDEDDLERYLQTELELGYSLSDISEIQDICDLDKKTIKKVIKKVSK